MADLADNMENLFLHAAAAKGLAFRVSVDPGLPPTLFTDQRRLEQILKNLINNSLKFTEQGKISLAFTQASEDVRFHSDTLVPAKTLAVSVADTGIGIPAEKQEAVFEAFQQADGSTGRKYGGMGLGLSIAKQLATVLGGEIHLRSEPEAGAVFSLFLPLQAEKKQPKKNCTCGSEPAEQEDRETNPLENQLYSTQQKSAELATYSRNTENNSKNDSIGVNIPVEQRDIITAFCRAENQNQGPIKKLLMMTEDTRIHSILVDFAESRNIEILEANTDLQAWNILRTQSISVPGNCLKVRQSWRNTRNGRKNQRRNRSQVPLRKCLKKRLMRILSCRINRYCWWMMICGTSFPFPLLCRPKA